MSHVLCFALLLASADSKPQVRLTLNPPLSVSQVEGRELNAILIIKDADEELWCPRIEWRWSDGTSSSEEGDCDPFEQTTPQQRERFVAHRTRKVFGTGVVRLIVRLLKGNKVLRRVEATAEIK